MTERFDQQPGTPTGLGWLVADASHSAHGEGPVWDPRDGALRWVDIAAPAVHRLTVATGERWSWTPPEPITSLAPRAAGGFVATTKRSFAFIDPETDRLELIATPEPDRPGNRFNDGKLDRRGSYWAGTMDDAEQRISGALYRLAPDLEVRRFDEGYGVTNGPAFSPDGRTMYHTDSPRRLIYAFDLDGDGAPGPRREWRRFDEADGHPDGMTVDAEGRLWVAFWDGWAIRCLDPSGSVVMEVELPVARPTSCAFAGEQLDRLFVTTAHIGLPDAARAAQPLAGALFEIAGHGARGVADTPFAG